MDQPLRLTVGQYDIGIGSDLRLTATDAEGREIWATSATQTPLLVVKHGSAPARELALASAVQTCVTPYEEDGFTGHRLTLSEYDEADVEVELSYAANEATGEVSVQVEQTGGSDTVRSVEHFYRFEKPVSQGGYVVVPHGSGYLIAADCPDGIPGDGPHGGFVGARWTLPIFGMFKQDHALCALVETWWDCEVELEHDPGEYSALDFHWQPSLGKLGYRRRFVLRFAEGMDYVGMAKLYRDYARSKGLLRTLKEKMEQTPQIERYVQGTLVRWGGWNPAELPEVLEQLERLRDEGFDLNLFFPKWSSLGYSEERVDATTADGNWQGFLLSEPVPGGWAALADLAEKARGLGCLIQGFVNPRFQRPGVPEFDPRSYVMHEDGQPDERELTPHEAEERNQAVLASIREHRLNMDVLYYDSYSAYSALPEDFSLDHSCSRRDGYEVQNRCFADTREAGIMPGAELARFWAIRDCDYWFYTDWSSDRLANTPVQGCEGPVGVPIPLFQLVFNDCYIAGFSGGGYELYNPGYDWWADQNARLYELLFVAAPCHNWLPEGAFPYDKIDAPEAEQRWTWLNKMGSLCRATKFCEMLSHEFVSADRKQHRVTFANGVVAEFDMNANRFRIQGVEGFTGEWETPPELYDS